MVNKVRIKVTESRGRFESHGDCPPVFPSSNGDERIATTVNEETGEEIEGQWEVFKNGKPLLDEDGNPITYPSNSQVGTIGFEYGF